LAFNEKLGAIASEADAGDLVPGIGPISVLGEPILHGLYFFTAKFYTKGMRSNPGGQVRL